MNALAVNPTITGTPLGTIGGQNLGPFGAISLTDNTAALRAVANTVSSVIGIITIAAGIWFMLQFLSGGFFWITAGGDKTKLESARHRINDAFIGLLIVVMGWSLLAIASQFFGVDFLLQNPGKLLPQIQIQKLNNP